MMPRSPTGAAALSIVSNSLLVAVKLAVGLLSGSLSILSQAVDSATDLVASFIAFFGLRMARAPADRSHPFGPGKFDEISGLLQAGLILLAAIL